MVGLWSWPRALVGGALSAVAVGVPTDVMDNPRGSSLLGAPAIGCPICIKVVIALLGTSGALGVRASVQPAPALASLIVLTAVVVRWRLRGCTPGVRRAVPGSSHST